MNVITPGVIKPDVPEIFRCKCHKCDAVLEYTEKDLHYGSRPSLGSSSRVTCPTPGCNHEILHDVGNNIKYSDEDRSRFFWAKFNADKERESKCCK